MDADPPTTSRPTRRRVGVTRVRASACLGAAAAGLLSALIGCGVARLGSGQVISAHHHDPSLAPVSPGTPLRASGRYFLDPDGRVILLRGANLAGNSKLPPFQTYDDPTALDRLAAQGMNAIRLLFIWEAFEPDPGLYDEAYLARMVAVAREAWARGLYVIVDIHQDGFSRHLCRGCGSGFPHWTISPHASKVRPDNGPGCKPWVFYQVTDPSMHRSLADFYADAHGARTRYLLMLDRVAGAFATVPGVIGYDLMNEPWGDEETEIAPLYRDGAATVRARHPTAILFLAGHATTGDGSQSRLPRPEFDNIAYAPHYYKPIVIVRNGWYGSTAGIERGFRNMEAKAHEWDVPLFLGEFGVGADAYRAGDYVAYLYDRLDQGFSSGAQWNYSPFWDEVRKDGWNAEDYNILDRQGRPRPNYRPRPYPRATAGLPVRFGYRERVAPLGRPCLEYVWEHRPERGPTEIYLPAAVFPASSTILAQPDDASWSRDELRQLLVVRAPREVTVRVTVMAP
jgi:endoglycosylceramidase